MDQPTPRNERGVALVVAIVALVVIGAIVAGTFFIGSVEHRTSINAVASGQAFEAAEAGLARTVGGWAPLAYVPGADVTLPPSPPLAGSAARYQVTVSPLNTALMLIKSTGTDRRGAASQTLSTLVRLVAADVRPRAAITTTRPIGFEGATFAIDGNDSMPAGWTNCPPEQGNQVAIRTSSASWHQGTLDADQQNGVTGSSGRPSVVTGDGSIADSTFNAFGELTYQRMAGSATIQYGSTESGPYRPTPALEAALGGCDYANQLNWGEPFRGAEAAAACADYFPVVHSAGDLHLEGRGRGQGILLVDGSLTVDGPFRFFGLVMVKGGVRLSGPAGDGAKIVGALLAQNGRPGDTSRFQGDATVQFSFCAVRRALAAGARPTPVTGHSWVQMF